MTSCYWNMRTRVILDFFVVHVLVTYNLGRRYMNQNLKLLNMSAIVHFSASNEITINTWSIK